MERFLTNFKGKRKLPPSDDDRNKSRKYETDKRKREFISSWTLSYPWLTNGPDGMTCTICTKYEKSGTFVTGRNIFKRDSIHQHEKSDSHKFNVIKHNGEKNPENSIGAKALRGLNQLTVNRLVFKFRNVFALCKKGRPYTEYQMLCDLDESKGLDIGTEYRTDKKAA